jgi:hypothetical protein
MIDFQVSMMMIKEWLVERWWDIVDVWDRIGTWLESLPCRWKGHQWIEFGYATDLEPRYICKWCGEERRL